MPIQVYTRFFKKAFKKTLHLGWKSSSQTTQSKSKPPKCQPEDREADFNKVPSPGVSSFSVLGISSPTALSCTRSWGWFTLSSFPRLSLIERRGYHFLLGHECGLCVHLCAQMHTFRCAHAEVRGEHQGSPSIALHLIPLR